MFTTMGTVQLTSPLQADVDRPRTSPFEIETTLPSLQEVNVQTRCSVAGELPPYDPWEVFDFVEIAKNAFHTA